MATQLEQPRALRDRIRLPLAFDPAGLATDLAAIEDTPWVAHFIRDNYVGHWGALPLRHKAGATHPVMQIFAEHAAEEFVDGPLLDRMPHVRALLARLHCPLRSVRLMRLTPGSEILEHRDHDLDAEAGEARLHVPIATSPEARFTLNGTRVDMAPGELWYLRLADPHSAANHGIADRVHLVIDARVNAWLAALLAGS